MKSTGTAPDGLAERSATMLDWLTGVIAGVGGDTEDLRVRVSPHAHQGSVLGQANVTVHGLAYRVQAVGPTLEDVGLLLVEQLANRLTYTRADSSAAGPPVHRGPLRILRRKNATLEHLTAAQAVRTKHRLAHQAHLFNDRDTGYDTAVFRDHAATRHATPALITDVRTAPLLTAATALARAARTGASLLFFAELPTGRGALLYARHAGGYGLVRSAS